MNLDTLLLIVDIIRKIFQILSKDIGKQFLT